MTHLIYYIGIAIFAVVFAFQIRKIKLSFPIFVRRMFWGSSIMVFLVFLYYTYVQFRLWQSSDITKFFFVDGPGYFLGYMSYRFWAQYLVSFLVALLFLWLASKHNKRHGGDIFYPGEPYILALSLFLLGHPLWVIYLVTVLIFYTTFSLLYRFKYLKQKQNNNIEPRISFYYGWIPTALLVILMKGAFATIPIIQVLVFSSEQFIL